MGLTTSRPSLSRLAGCLSGVSQLFLHQATAINAVLDGKSLTSTTTHRTTTPRHPLPRSAAGRSLPSVILLPPAGQHLCLCTATSSGKSLVYTLPVLATLLTMGGRALFLFPTKVPPSLRPHALASPAYPLALAPPLESHIPWMSASAA